MPIINFSKLVAENLQSILNQKDDWVEWRYCYSGGRRFREEYLEKFSDRENDKEFKRRRDLTPIPAYARLEINRVKNSLSQRFPDIIRRGGSEKWADAVHGNGRGVDRRGSSMDSYVSKFLLAEILVMGKVGVLVDAPRVTGNSAADVPEDFRPYLNWYPVENIERLVPAPVESPSDWTAVLVKDINKKFDIETATTEDVNTFRYYYLDPDRNNKVTIATIDDTGKEVKPLVLTDLDKIPFVVFDILESLIKDVCSYQIAHLNLISADTLYAIDANYPIMTRQRGNSVPAHLEGEDEEADIGIQKGIWYDRGLDAPGFISPPVDSMKTSMESRKMFKQEVHELVTGALASLGEEGTIDAGLAFIGQCLEDGESRLWDHWAAYEQRDEARRETPNVVYPEDWSLKTDEERLNEADKYIDLMNKLPGQEGKKQAAKMAYDRLYRGRLASDDLVKIKAEVDAAPYSISDAKIVIDAKKEGIFSAETASLALGANKDEAEKAKKDQEEKAAAIAAAQSDQQVGGPGNPDASVDPNSNSVARQGDDPINGVEGRGEGVNNEDEE